MMAIFWRQLAATYCASILCANAFAQEPSARNVVVTGENEEEHDQFTELGEYAQPAWAERARLSSTTSVYVLSPYEMFVGNVWEFGSDRHGKSAHNFTQEIDLGLLHRFEIGFEHDFGLVDDDAHETSATLEARYAFANWNKIPLNPAISLEYVFRFGKSSKTFRRQSDAIVPRLLLGQNFGDHFGYGLNFSLSQDLSRNNGREVELDQAIACGIMKGRLEVGAEARYRHDSGRGRVAAENELVIGPSFSWKPTRQLRVAFAPLFGCTNDSPSLASFLLVSYEFGGAEAVVAPPRPRD